jgi:hypothetical protein
VAYKSTCQPLISRNDRHAFSYSNYVHCD